MVLSIGILIATFSPNADETERRMVERRIKQARFPDLKIVEIQRSGNRLTATFQNTLNGDHCKRTADHILVEAGTDDMDELFFALKDSARNLGITDIEALANYTPQPEPKRVG